MQHRTELYDTYVTSGQAGKVDGDNGALSLRAAYLRQLIKQHLPADPMTSILDLGCGHGAVLHFCREAGYRSLEGVDVSLEQVNLARAMGLDCIVQGDLFSHLRQAQDGAYGAVIAFDILEHFTRDEVVTFLREIKRVLKPSGRLILHVPNGESPFVGAVLYGDFSHEVAFTRRSLAQLSATLGFAAIECFEDRPVPHGTKSLLRLVLWHCLRLVFRFVNAIETGDGSSQAIYSRNLLAVMVK